MELSTLIEKLTELQEGLDDDNDCDVQMKVENMSWVSIKQNDEAIGEINEVEFEGRSADDLTGIIYLKGN